MMKVIKDEFRDIEINNLVWKKANDGLTTEEEKKLKKLIKEKFHE